MAYSVTSEVDFKTCVCSECGVTFCLPDNYEETRRSDHKGFYCPNGHSQFFPAKSEAEELEQSLRDAESKLANAQLELLAAAAERKRLEKRIKNGVCPCCHRSFVQLHRHMKSKHPDYAS
jgi:hypothetical protein